MTAQPRSSTMADALEAVLAATALAQRERAASPMTTGEAEGDMAAILRENLRAASRHVVMGHEGASFRDCLHPGCVDAANLIPHLETIEASATDSELDVIFDRVQAALNAGAFDEAPSEPASEDDSDSAPTSRTSR